jgi:anti-sigma factor ChrR (cupin superfamily)
MEHINTEDLVEFVEGRIPRETRAAVEAHLAACAACQGLRQEFESLLGQLRQDAAFEPPADLVQWGIDLFQPLLRSKEQRNGGSKKARSIIAAVVFDTYDEPMLAGVRRAGLPPRQLLFRAGDVDIDVKIESLETDGRISLAGQVLSNTAAFFDNTSVKLESHGVVRYRTTTNPVGEFSFDEVPKDTYHLSVELPEGELTLFCVHRGNS